MGLIKKLLIGAGVLIALATGAGCAGTKSHITPVEKYQNDKNRVERRYNEEAGKRTNQAKEEYGPALGKERVQEAEKLSKDIRKNDEPLIAEMVKQAEEKRKYDQRAQELEKRLDGTYSLNQMMTYSNKEQKPSNFRAGVFAFTAEQDSEREKPRKRTGWGVEAGYVFNNGWTVSGTYEFDGDSQSVADGIAFTNMTSTANTYGAKLGKVFELGEAITVEPYAELGIRVEGNKFTGAFSGSGTPINHTNTQSIAYGGAGVEASVRLGKDSAWKFTVGVAGKKYEGGQTRTTSRNALDEFQGFAGFTVGGN